MPPVTAAIHHHDDGIDADATPIYTPSTGAPKVYPAEPSSFVYTCVMTALQPQGSLSTGKKINPDDNADSHASP